MWTELIILVYPLALFAVAIIVGTGIRRRHAAALTQRERDVASVFVSERSEITSAGRSSMPPPQLIAHEVTLSADYFITFLAKLKHLIGGELGVYSDLLMRARREAALRVIEEARDAGYNAVVNLRIDFADISGNALRKRPSTMVTILASGTAMQLDRTSNTSADSGHSA